MFSAVVNAGKWRRAFTVEEHLVAASQPAVSHQLHLAVLECAGNFLRAQRPHEVRDCVAGQLLLHVLRQLLPVGAGVAEDDGSHADATISVGQLHPVHVGFLNAGAAAERISHLVGRHVLALPAERVANPVHEVNETVAVHPHQVPRAEELIPVSERALHDFFLGGLRARVARERLVRAFGVDASEDFAHFVVVAECHPAAAVDDGLLRHHVELHNAISAGHGYGEAAATAGAAYGANVSARLSQLFHQPKRMGKGMKPTAPTSFIVLTSVMLPSVEP